MGIQSWFLSKPYWLRVGIIGAIISIGLSFVSLICLIVIEGVVDTVCIFPLWPGAVLYFSVIDIFPFLLVDGEIAPLAAMNIFNFFVLFSLGIVIGWLVGKIKSKL